MQVIGLPPSSTSTSSSTNVAFPPRLSESLRRLYHFRRGPLVSPGPLQSMDDRAETRSLFLRLPLHDCYSMLAPKLWSCSVPSSLDSSSSSSSSSNTPYMEDVPPETLALWSNVSKLCFCCMPASSNSLSRLFGSHNYISFAPC
jgi:hypothetical protein